MQFISRALDFSDFNAFEIRMQTFSNSILKSEISDKFDLGPDYGDTGNSMAYPVTHNFRVYTRVRENEDINKQQHYESHITERNR